MNCALLLQFIDRRACSLFSQGQALRKRGTPVLRFYIYDGVAYAMRPNFLSINLQLAAYNFLHITHHCFSIRYTLYAIRYNTRYAIRILLIEILV